MENSFRLRFLGPAQIKQAGQPVRGLGSGKALALLGYLAVQDHSVSREFLADLFWSDKPANRGRANLSWLIHHICKHLPGCMSAGIPSDFSVNPLTGWIFRLLLNWYPRVMWLHSRMPPSCTAGTFWTGYT